MKNLITIKALLLLSGVIFLSNSSIAGNTKYPVDKEYPLELHLLKNYLDLPKAEIEEVSYKFYDSKDNLVYQGVFTIGENADKKLVKYLNESDLLTEVKGVKIHRLK